MSNELQILSAPSLPVETKLTKSELIELIIDGMVSELNLKLSELQKQQAEASKVRLQDMLDVLPSGAGLEIRDSWQSKGKLAHVSMSIELKPTGVLKERMDRLNEINAEMNRVSTTLHELRDNKQRAKNEILKRFLEQTPEGRNVLEQINGFKLTLQAKLLKAAGK